MVILHSRVKLMLFGVSFQHLADRKDFFLHIVTCSAVDAPHCAKRWMLRGLCVCFQVFFFFCTGCFGFAQVQVELLLSGLLTPDAWLYQSDGSRATSV